MICNILKNNYFIIYHDPLYQGNLVKNIIYKQMKDIIMLQDVLNFKTNKIIMFDIKDPFLNTDAFYQIINKSNLNIYVMSFYNNLIKKLDIKERKYKVGLLNYVLNTNKMQDKYDFLCILGSVLNRKIINEYINLNKKLFVYNIKKENIKYEYPYYIVDSVNR